MAGKTVSVNIRMDANQKAKADELFAELGMSLATACNVFVRQCLRERGIPFQVKIDGPAREAAEADLPAKQAPREEENR